MGCFLIPLLPGGVLAASLSCLSGDFPLACAPTHTFCLARERMLTRVRTRAHTHTHTHTAHNLPPSTHNLQRCTHLCVV